MGINTRFEKDVLVRLRTYTVNPVLPNAQENSSDGSVPPSNSALNQICQNQQQMIEDIIDQLNAGE